MLGASVDVGGGDRASKRELKCRRDVNGSTSNEFYWAGVLTHRVCVGSEDPGLDCVAPPFGAEGELVHHQRTNSFD